METLDASDGLKIRYFIDDFTDPWRPKETLVLLHAAMGSSRRFYAWVPHLARYVCVVRPDLRGHGQSEMPVEELTIERLALDVIELLDQLGCKRAHIAGSSAGGIIAQQVAISHPDRLASLGIFAAIPGMKKWNLDYRTWISQINEKGIKSFLAETIQNRFDISEADPDFIEWFLDESSKNNPEFIARFVTLMAGVDLRDQLNQISCPTLVVVPGNDPISPLSYYEVLRDRIPNVQFIVYEGLPHNITDAIPDRCAGELKRFLVEIDATRATH